MGPRDDPAFFICSTIDTVTWAEPHHGTDSRWVIGEVSVATEFQRIFGLLKLKNRLNEGSELAVVDDLSDVGEATAVGPDTNHRGAHAAFPGEVLPRLLRQRHENPTFLEDSERSPLRISAHRVEDNVHVANMIFKARRRVVDRFVAAELSDQIDVIGAGSGADHSCAARLCKLHRHRPASLRSMGFTAAAFARTRTCPRPGSGRGARVVLAPLGSP